MAATIAKAIGYDSTRTKRVQRLGSQAVSVQAATWKTFVDVVVNKDGSGYVEIRRGDRCYRYIINEETNGIGGDVALTLEQVR